MRRILKNTKATPPWPENELKNIFEKVINITNIKLPQVKLCSGNMKDKLFQAHTVKLPFLPQGDIDQLYLEALHTRTWQLGNTTLPFYEWIKNIGVDQAMMENHLIMAYPRRYQNLLREDSKKAAFQRFMWEQDFRETDISFEPWYVTKGEHLEYLTEL